MTLRKIRWLSLYLSLVSLLSSIGVCVVVLVRDKPVVASNVVLPDIGVDYNMISNLVLDIVKDYKGFGVADTDSADTYAIVGKAWQCGDWYVKISGRIYKIGEKYKGKIIEDITLDEINLDGMWYTIISPPDKDVELKKESK